MDRWIGKIAIVTGASAGIGATIALELAKSGMIVIGLARRKQKIDELATQLSSDDVLGELHGIKCDLNNESEINAVFREIEDKFGGIDVLINNAAICTEGQLLDPNNSQYLREQIMVNVLGLAYCTREAVKSMKTREWGHIVHINSTSGHYNPFYQNMEPMFNIYTASKHAVTAMTETHRQELIYAGSKIKVTSISPGAVDTGILDYAELQKLYGDLFKATLQTEDIANAVLYVLGTPPHVQVHELIIRPVGEMC